MGYAVTTSMKSLKAKTEMLEFLAEHYRPISVFMEPNTSVDETFRNYDSSRFIRTEEGYLDLDTKSMVKDKDGGLCYDQGTSKIGFEYGACVYWPFLVCRWMALRAGRVRRFQCVSDGTESVPYYIYDGYSAVPLVVGNGSDAQLPYEHVTESGFRSYPTLRYYREKYGELTEENLGEMAEYVLGIVEVENACKRELDRLTVLWNGE